MERLPRQRREPHDPPQLFQSPLGTLIAGTFEGADNAPYRSSFEVSKSRTPHVTSRSKKSDGQMKRRARRLVQRRASIAESGRLCRAAWK